MSSALFAAVALSLASPAQGPSHNYLPDYGKDPTVNLSAIRMLDCGTNYGSGFLITDNILVTAHHVVEGRKCVDMKTRKPIVPYHVEADRDFALARTELSGIPPIKYDCSRFNTTDPHASYGYSGYLQDYVIFRQSQMIVYDKYQVLTYRGRTYKPMRSMFGAMVPGHSGGPIINTLTGTARGINNAGLINIFGLALGPSSSTELADTVLCAKKAHTVQR